MKSATYGEKLHIRISASNSGDTNNLDSADRADLLKSLIPSKLTARVPRRIVTRSGARVRGIHPSLRHKKSLSWETVDERALIKAMDASEATTELASQVVTLEITGDGSKFEYTPDVAVVRFGQITVFECKPAEVIESEAWQKRLLVIEEYFTSSGINFIVLPNEVQPSATVQTNIDLVLSAGRPLQYPMARRKEDLAVLHTKKPSTFRRTDQSGRAAGSIGGIRPQVVVLQYARAAGTRNGNPLCS
jgi:hypothetical protein